MTVAVVIVPADEREALADGAGRAAVRRIVDAAWAGGAMPIVVVADDPDGRVAAVLQGSPAVLAAAGGADDPMAAHRAGAVAAMAAVSETSALLLWPGRMTWVDPETVTSLIEAHGRHPDGIVRPERSGQPGWPVLLPAARASEILDSGRRDFEARFAGSSGVTMLELGDPGTVLDRQTPLDALPRYAGPPEPVGGAPPEWGAAAADAPDPESSV